VDTPNPKADANVKLATDFNLSALMIITPHLITNLAVSAHHRQFHRLIMQQLKTILTRQLFSG
jgi:hypothetical protein